MVAKSFLLSLKARFGGGANASQVARSVVEERLRYIIPKATAATIANPPAAIHGIRCRQTWGSLSTTGVGAKVVSDLPEELVGADSDSNAKLRSCAE